MRNCLLASILLLSGTSFAAEINANSQPNEKASYSYGYLIGKSNAANLQDIDTNAFAKGLQQALSGEPAAFTDEEMIQVLSAYKKRIESNQLVQLQEKAKINLEQGQRFLKENATRKEIKTTKSGLQYQVLNTGQGRAPKANAKVEVHYEGRLLDGTVFDSSFARDKPETFQINQVITGWQEVLKLMKPGAKYQVYIPAHLAYGEIGAGDAIEPNSTLIFDLELIRIVD